MTLVPQILRVGVGVAVLVMAVGHARAQDRDRVVVREVWRTTGEGHPDGPIGAISGAVAMGDGVIWFSDPIQRRVVRVDQGGSVRIIARTGDGPGEVRAPTLLDRRSGLVFVYDLGRGSIEVFDEVSGAFETRVSLRTTVTWPKGFAALHSGGFVVSGGVVGSRFAIHQFAQDGTWVTSWDRVPATADWRNALVVAGGPIVVASPDQLLYSRAAPHEIIEFRVGRGRMIDLGRRIAADASLLQAVGDDAVITSVESGRRVQSFRPYARSSGVFLLSDGTILNVVTSAEEDSSTFELYDRSNCARVALTHTAHAVYPWSVNADDEVVVSYLDSAMDVWVLAILRFADAGRSQ
ncbi:MAG: hypothetical protein WD934_00185 [Gemmatimonadales bacterium]